ncbi:hypothetical protein N7563_14350 [Leclercia adecarboxylata ATCC 23216 = NBRC 102595]|nr:hypothetical protein [Leclercia adecarboxylata ATCC 23216 = NBRC 102595]
MKNIAFISISFFLLSGCHLFTQKNNRSDVTLYQDSEGETAKLRVIGFNDFTYIKQIRSCTEYSELGFLRDYERPERNPSRIIDKGFKKATPQPENVPLDYQERLIPTNGWLSVHSALFASDGGICVLDTRWFKPEKNALYEVRNRLNKSGNICSMEFVQINQDTGKTQKVNTHETLSEFLPCQTLSR